MKTFSIAGIGCLAFIVAGNPAKVAAQERGQGIVDYVPFEEADATIEANGLPIRAYRTGEDTGPNGTEKVWYSRTIGVESDDKGNWFRVERSGTGARVDFKVVFPHLEPSQQEALAKQLGVDPSKISFNPFRIVGYEIRIVNGGKSKVLKDNKPTAVPKEVPDVISVNEVLDDGDLARHLLERGEATQILIKAFTRFRSQDVQEIQAKRFADRLERGLERLLGARSGRYIVSQDVKRDLATEISSSFEGIMRNMNGDLQKGFDIMDRLMAAGAFADVTTNDIRAERDAVVVLGNDVIRLNFAPTELSDLKTKFQQKDAALNEMKVVWKIIHDLAIDSHSATEFNEAFARNFSGNKSKKAALGATIKGIPINFGFNSDSSRSGAGSITTNIKRDEFDKLKKYASEEGENGERLFRSSEGAWEGNVFIKQLTSNLPDAFSLVDVAKLQREAKSSLKVRQDREVFSVSVEQEFNAHEKMGYSRVSQTELNRLLQEVDTLRREVAKEVSKIEGLERSLAALKRQGVVIDSFDKVYNKNTNPALLRGYEEVVGPYTEEVIAVWYTLKANIAPVSIPEEIWGEPAGRKAKLKVQMGEDSGAIRVQWHVLLKGHR